MTAGGKTGECQPGHILVGTPGAIYNKCKKDRRGNSQILLTKMKCLIIDEADALFEDDNSRGCINKLIL